MPTQATLPESRKQLASLDDAELDAFYLDRFGRGMQRGEKVTLLDHCRRKGELARLAALLAFVSCPLFC